MLSGMTTEKVQKITISVPPDLFAREEAERRSRGLSRSELINTLCRQALDALDDHRRAARYATAYAVTPETAEEHAWAEQAYLTLAEAPWELP